jgi:hypothetical protein
LGKGVSYNLWFLPGEIQTMRYFSKAESVGPDFSPASPAHYLRLADLAQLHGDREDVEAMVEMAFFVFDLFLAGSEMITDWEEVCRGKSN